MLGFRPWVNSQYYGLDHGLKPLYLVFTTALASVAAVFAVAYIWITVADRLIISRKQTIILLLHICFSTYQYLCFLKVTGFPVAKFSTFRLCKFIASKDYTQAWQVTV